LVGPLPPGNYAVERMNFTPQGVRSNLMTSCERRLLTVMPGQRTNSFYDRKTGRPIAGHVRGLEQVKLRYAFVTIDFWGPEEQFNRGAKPSRMMTHFDVIPIASDGQFTTPPLPPNQYEFRLTGMLASTPAGDGQTFDIQEAVTIAVTEAGAVRPVEIVVGSPDARTKSKVARQGKARNATPDPKKPRLEIQARDESGAPVKDFEAQLYSLKTASHEAAMGTDGLAVVAGDEWKGWSQGDLIVYAPGFASKVVEIGPIEGLRQLDVTLQRGKKVRLRVRDWAGKPIPSSLMPLPQGYLPRHRRDALFAAAIKDAGMRTQSIAAINFLNVRAEPGGDFIFHIPPDEQAPLYFGFSHPDVLLYYELGPVPVSQVQGGTWDVVLPQPATLDLSLQTPRDADGQALCAAGFYMLVPIVSGFENGVPAMESGELKEPNWRAKFERLAPGAYNVHIQTTPRDVATAPPGLEARPGVYHDIRRIDLKPLRRGGKTWGRRPDRAGKHRAQRQRAL
jgi:hypothetical protein